MIKDILVSILQFFLLVVFQVFILDNVEFLGYINPMIYIWFIIMLPFATPRWLLLIASFILGVSIDVFSADIGVNACACVLIGFLRPIFLNAFSGNIDNVAFLRPSTSSLGWKNFLPYISFMTLTHQIVYYLVETFTFSEIGQTFLRIVLSSAVSILLILLADVIFFRNKE